MRKRSGQVHSRESSATLQLTVSLLYLDRCRFLIYSEILWYNISESLNYQTESMRLTLKIMNRRDIMCIE